MMREAMVRNDRAVAGVGAPSAAGIGCASPSSLVLARRAFARRAGREQARPTQAIDERSDRRLLGAGGSQIGQSAFEVPQVDLRGILRRGPPPGADRTCAHASRRPSAAGAPPRARRATTRTEPPRAARLGTSATSAERVAAASIMLPPRPRPSPSRSPLAGSRAGSGSVSRPAVARGGEPLAPARVERSMRSAMRRGSSSAGVIVGARPDRKAMPCPRRSLPCPSRSCS